MTTNNEFRALCEELLVKIAEYNSADPCPDRGKLIALYALSPDSSPMNSNIETIRKVWLEGDGYLLIRPWPDNPDCMELCTEPGKDSQEWFGKISIAFASAEQLKTLAEALLLAANEMETKDGQS
jgi:hypothetical protein